MTVSGASSRARRSDALSSSAPNRVSRFHLRGPSPALDARVHAIRPDIADVALADRVFAPHYARPLPHRCLAVTVTIRAAASASADAVSELLHGECFAVVDASGDWAWGFGTHDHYVGYVPVAALGPAREATHVVDRPAALVFTRPDIKSPVAARLPMGARVTVLDEIDGFLRTDTGFVHHRHCAPAGDAAEDPVEVAERLIGAPYRWGGRSGDGIDCSGLVQLAFALCGRAVPRDSDQQREALGTRLDEAAPLRRGDLVFLPGHVGMMADGETLLHANAHWMETVREPLADVLARQPVGGVRARKRIEG